MTRRRAGRGLAGGSRRPSRSPGSSRAIALGHQLSGHYQSRLPLAVYLVGAGDDRRAVVPLRARPRRPRRAADDGRAAPPAAGGDPLHGCEALGLIAWVWIVAQGIAGGESNGDVAHALPVGLRLGRRRDGLVPHRTGLAVPRPVLHPPRRRRLGPATARRHRLGRRPTTRPRLGRWPALVGFLVVVWLELVLVARRRRRCSSSSSATPRSPSR